MKTATMDIQFELQHLKQISEFNEALFPYHLQAGYHVNCVLDGGWVHCGNILKSKWSGEINISDKCEVVTYVWNKDLHINVRVRQTVRLKQSIQRQGFKISKIKFCKIEPLFVGMMRLVTGISEGKE